MCRPILSKTAIGVGEGWPGHWCHGQCFWENNECKPIHGKTETKDYLYDTENMTSLDWIKKGELWCSTKTFPNGTHISGWGYLGKCEASRKLPHLTLTEVDPSNSGIYQCTLAEKG